MYKMQLLHFLSIIYIDAANTFEVTGRKRPAYLPLTVTMALVEYEVPRMLEAMHW